MSKIEMFTHCRHCLLNKPDGVSPKDWLMIEAGVTDEGTFKIQCKRCDRVVYEFAHQDSTLQNLIVGGCESCQK